MRDVGSSAIKEHPNDPITRPDISSEEYLATSLTFRKGRGMFMW